MVQEDWIDFVCRLTTKFDKRYVPGALSDPGDLLEHVLSIVPGIAQMCTMDSSWTTTPPCGCHMARKEILTEECGLTITLSSNESLIRHINQIFQPEQVSDYRCDCCGRQSSSTPSGTAAISPLSTSISENQHNSSLNLSSSTSRLSPPWLAL